MHENQDKSFTLFQLLFHLVIFYEKYDRNEPHSLYSFKTIRCKTKGAILINKSRRCNFKPTGFGKLVLILDVK